MIFTSLASLEFPTAVPEQKNILELELSPLGLIIPCFIPQEWLVFSANDESQLTGHSGHKDFYDIQVLEEAGGSRHWALQQPHLDLGDSLELAPPHWPEKALECHFKEITSFYCAGISAFPQGGLSGHNT